MHTSAENTNSKIKIRTTPSDAWRRHLPLIEWEETDYAKTKLAVFSFSLPVHKICKSAIIPCPPLHRVGIGASCDRRADKRQTTLSLLA